MKKNMLFFLMLAVSTSTFAHSYWLEVKGNGKINDTATVMLYFGEYENGLRENKSYFLKNMETFIAWYVDADGNKQILNLVKNSNCVKASFVPNKNGNYIIFFKENTRAVQDWAKHGLGIIRPFENLKANYVVGTESKISLSHFIESKIDIVKKKEKFKLLLNNKTFANKEITVTNSDKKTITIKTDSKGFFALEKQGGMYLIDVDYKDNLKGEYNGKSYESNRYKYCLTITNKINK